MIKHLTFLGLLLLTAAGATQSAAQQNAHLARHHRSNLSRVSNGAPMCPSLSRQPRQTMAISCARQPSRPCNCLAAAVFHYADRCRLIFSATCAIHSIDLF